MIPHTLCPQPERPVPSPAAGKEPKSPTAKKGKRSNTPSKIVMDTPETLKADDGFFPFKTSEVEPAKLALYNEKIYYSVSILFTGFALVKGF